MAVRRVPRIKTALVIALALVVPSAIVQNGIPGSEALKPHAAKAAFAWSFCSPANPTLCIEKVVVTDGQNRATEYLSNAALTDDDVIVSVSCLSPTGQCLGGPSSSEIIKANTEKCASLPSEVYFPAYVMAAAGGRSESEVSVFLNLGTKEPGLSIGSGILSTEAKQDSSGVWRYVARTKSVVKTQAQFPAGFKRVDEPGYQDDYKQFLATASATNASSNSIFTIHSPSNLRWIISPYNPLGGHNLPWVTEKMCDYIPLNGAWVSANASAFEFGIQTNEVKSQLPWYFKALASAPHFVRSDMLEIQPTSTRGTNNLGPFNGPLIVNPAEIKMWVPREYATKLGYSTADEMKAGITVTTEDGQAPSPTVVDSNGGFLINFGISHYSVPNPSMRFSPKEGFIRPIVVGSETSTAPQGISVRVARTISGKSLASFAKLTIAKGAKITVKVLPTSSKICKAVGTTIRGIKAGTCKVSVSVAPAKGRSKSKTISLKVAK